MTDENFAEEFFGLPEYVIAHARPIPMSLGVRVYHWSRHGNLLMPQFTAVLSAVDLIMISRDVHDTAIRSLSEGASLVPLKH